MVLHFLRRWLDNLGSNQAAGRHLGKHRPGPYRPQVEALEDRLVPAGTDAGGYEVLPAMAPPQVATVLPLPAHQALALAQILVVIGNAIPASNPLAADFARVVSDLASGNLAAARSRSW